MVWEKLLTISFADAGESGVNQKGVKEAKLDCRRDTLPPLVAADWPAVWDIADR
jgi:hypothetical protein